MIQIRNARVLGPFDSEKNVCSPDDPNCRVLLMPISVLWEWRESSKRSWIFECINIPDGTKWNGDVHIPYVDYMIPAWAKQSSASLVYDICIGKFKLASGKVMQRVHADLLFLNLLRWLAKHRVVGGWKYRPQLALAEKIYIYWSEYKGIDWKDHEHSEHQ